MKSLLLFLSFASLTAATYDCATFDLTVGRPAGINNAGLIVGATPDGHGFLRDNAGNISLIDYPAATATSLAGINNNGIILGSFRNSASGTSGIFTRDTRGVFSTLTVPPPYAQGGVIAGGINDAGAIFGLNSANGAYFILNPDGTATAVPLPPAFQPLPGTQPGSINNSLQYLEVLFSAGFGGGGTGSSYLGGPGGDFIPMQWNHPAAHGSQAYGLNNAGTVVGTSGLHHAPPFAPPVGAFVRDPSGAFSELICTNSLLAGGVAATAINDSGVITGAGDQANFVATPLPGAPQFNTPETSLNFGNYVSGSPATPLSFTISNSGSQRLDLGSIGMLSSALSGSSALFIVSGCVSQGAVVSSLAPGASCLVSVRPGSQIPILPVGAATDSVLIDDSAPGAPHLIPVSVNVVAPALPTCQIVSVLDGPPKQVNIAVQDVDGLGHIAASLNNATYSDSGFVPGTTALIVVTATKIDQSQSSTVTLQLFNQLGNSITCDPVDFTLDVENGARVHTFRALNASEHYIRVDNGNPGLRDITFLVNGHEIAMTGLSHGQTRELNIQSAMHPDHSNRVTARAAGRKGSSASILIGDASIR